MLPRDWVPWRITRAPSWKSLPGVVGGMLAITVLGVLLVPAFYVAVERLGEWRGRRGTTATE